VPTEKCDSDVISLALTCYRVSPGKRRAIAKRMTKNPIPIATTAKMIADIDAPIKMLEPKQAPQNASVKVDYSTARTP
jgi:hypothetical protein